MTWLWHGGANGGCDVSGEWARTHGWTFECELFRSEYAPRFDGDGYGPAVRVFLRLRVHEGNRGKATGSSLSLHCYPARIELESRKLQSVIAAKRAAEVWLENGGDDRLVRQALAELRKPRIKLFFGDEHVADLFSEQFFALDYGEYVADYGDHVRDVRRWGGGYGTSQRARAIAAESQSPSTDAGKG